MKTRERRMGEFRVIEERGRIEGMEDCRDDGD